MDLYGIPHSPFPLAVGGSGPTIVVYTWIPKGFHHEQHRDPFSRFLLSARNS